MTNDVKVLIYKDEAETIKLASWVGNWMTVGEALAANDINMDTYATDNGWDGWDYEALEVVTEDDYKQAK